MYNCEQIKLHYTFAAIDNMVTKTTIHMITTRDQVGYLDVSMSDKLISSGQEL